MLIRLTGLTLSLAAALTISSPGLAGPLWSTDGSSSISSHKQASKPKKQSSSGNKKKSAPKTSSKGKPAPKSLWDKTKTKVVTNTKGGSGPAIHGGGKKGNPSSTSGQGHSNNGGNGSPGQGNSNNSSGGSPGQADSSNPNDELDDQPGAPGDNNGDASAQNDEPPQSQPTEEESDETQDVPRDSSTDPLAENTPPSLPGDDSGDLGDSEGGSIADSDQHEDLPIDPGPVHTSCTDLSHDDSCPPGEQHDSRLPDPLVDGALTTPDSGIPEPATLALLGLAVVAGSMSRRRSPQS